MKTIVFIARHSEPFRKLIGEYNSNEIEQIRNEKNPLSVNGEKKALQMSEYKELQDIEVIYSSHYVRAMATAKYIAEKNNIKLNVDFRLGERKFGVKTMSDLPKDFYEHQFSDWNYKFQDGESLNEVKDRMTEVFFEILNKNKGKKIMIVSHGTSLTTLLSTWCNIILNKETNLRELFFNDNIFFKGNWHAPELFKLEFNNNDLIKIENIKYII